MTISGFDPFLRSENSVLLRNREVGLKSAASNDIRYGQIRVGRVGIGSLIQVSGSVTASGGIATGTHVVVTSTISPQAGYSENIIGGWFSNEIYEGTAAVAGSMIFPAPGAGVAADRFRCYGGYRQLGGNEINHRAQVAVYNNSGGSVSIFAAVKWKYIMNNAGTIA